MKAQEQIDEACRITQAQEQLWSNGESRMVEERGYTYSLLNPLA